MEAMPSTLVRLIFVFLIISVIVIVALFVLRMFGGGDYCLTRFQSEVNDFLREASTTYGSSVVYKPFKIESCVKDFYVDCSGANEGIFYTYTADGSQKSLQPGVFGSISFVNCGTSGSGDMMEPGFYMVKIMQNKLDCQYGSSNLEQTCVVLSSSGLGGAP